MEINKEFAPITLKINTREDLRELKTIASQAVSCDPYRWYQFRSDRKDEPSWMTLARKILEL